MDNTNEKLNLLLNLNIYFFDDGDKTEEATPKKKKKAREDGQVAKSPEVSTGISLLVSFSSIKAFAPMIYRNSLEIFNFNFSTLSEIDDIFQSDFLTRYVSFMFTKIVFMVLPIMLVAMVVGIIVNIAQVGWAPSFKLIKPNFKKLNPLSGFKRIFSFKSIIELIKSIAKLFIITNVIISKLQEEKYLIFKVVDLGLLEAVIIIGNIIIDMGISVGLMYLLIAIVDYGYTYFKHNKDLKMTKQEVKEEYKQAEGDPHVKGAIKQKMRQMSMRRMMQELPTADVIITNPTHFAVALRYDRDRDIAPIVVAKGADFLAQKIKEAARENKIEIIENKPLARTLYSSCEIGKIIPPELYQAVAEILAFVYKLKNAI